MKVAGDVYEGNENQLVSPFTLCPPHMHHDHQYKPLTYYQWEAQTTPAGLWRFKNVQFGLYLGIEKGQVAKDGLATRGVSHPFNWIAKRTDEAGPSPAVFKYVFKAD